MRTPNNSALIVVDVQESFRHSTYWSEADVPAFLAAVQKLTDDAASSGVPVVQILHVQPEGAFARESGFVRALDGYRIAPDVTFHKTHHSAFAGTDLQAWLTEHGVTRVVVCGIRTEQCCETTSRHASDLGYAVDYVTDATLTFPMTHPRTGRTYSPAEIKERTELVLEGRFATIVR
jgi:nicotinamidase-related amidase